MIDAGQCLSLYNEVAGTFPAWIPKDAHNALMGCMRCQEKCKANRDGLQRFVRLPEVLESETLAVLNGEFTEALSETLSTKLNKFTPATSIEYFPIFTRNLSVLLDT